MNEGTGGSAASSGLPDAPGAGVRPESRVRAVVEVLAKALTDYPDQVRVTESRHRGTVLVELFVAAGDLGRLIGRQGRTAAAIRTLAAIAGEQEGKSVTLEFRENR
jgi:predicted RNA-binding protein YlqC (UPF0109 family)